MMVISIRVVKMLLNLAASVSGFFCMVRFLPSRLRLASILLGPDRVVGYAQDPTGVWV
jgi:hypothetical protein